MWGAMMVTQPRSGSSGDRESPTPGLLWAEGQEQGARFPGTPYPG